MKRITSISSITRFRPLITAVMILVMLMGLWGAQSVLAAGTVSITTTSQQTFWLDANKCNAQGQRAAWLSFIVTNTGATTLTNVTVTFAGFTGTNATYFKAPTDLTRTFSTLAPGQAVPVYFYVDYSEVCNHPQGGGSPYAGYTANYSLSVASPTLTTSPTVYNGTVLTDELLTAAAAGLAVSSTLGPGVYVGQILTQTVAYSFGNNSDLFFQPAYEAGFQDSCLRLVGSEITAVSGSVSTSLIGMKDRLWFPTASVPAGGGTISVTYSWEILCVSTSQVVHPWAAAKSGQKYKYDNSGGSSTTFPVPTQALTAAKSVSPASLLASEGPVTWTITFSNPTAVPLKISKITDLIPSCMSINTPTAAGSQVTSSNSSSIPAVNAIGSVSWVGIDLGSSTSSTYRVAANSTLTLIYTTNISNCPTDQGYTNSATGTVGTTTVGPVTATVWIGNPTAVNVESFSATRAKNSVLLNWTTASEVHNLGFNLYRATAVDGARIKLNAKMIPALPGSQFGADYSYTDRDLKPKHTYYYWLEDVDIHGIRHLTGPVSVKTLAGKK